eukprot:Hpha_TRINITY_DN16367_c1_g2::TRINITY_DN16367_c1_g2_i1::g.62869::m.62869
MALARSRSGVSHPQGPHIAVTVQKEAPDPPQPRAKGCGLGCGMFKVFWPTVDLRGLRCCRFLVGLAAALNAVEAMGHVDVWLTDAGACPRREFFDPEGKVNKVLGAQHATSSLFFATDDITTLTLALLLLAGAALAFGLGLWVPWSSVLTWALDVSLSQRLGCALYSGDALRGILIFWCAVLPMGSEEGGAAAP